MRSFLKGLAARALGNQSSATPLKLAFVGCGDHARTNLYPCLPYLPIELVAICAKRKASAERAALAFGARAAYDDFREMFAKETLDAAIVCVNSKEHFAIAAAALERGVHVFVEKPAAATLAECEALADLERRSGKHVMVGFMKRHAPAYRKAKEILETGSFGDLAMVDTRFHVGPLGDDEEFLREVAIHHFDLIRFLAGDVRSLHVERHGSRRGATFAVAIRFESGAVGTMRLSSEQSWRAHNERVELLGDGQSIVIDNVVSLKHFKSGDEMAAGSHAGSGHAFWEPNFTVPTLQNQALYLNGFGYELEHFVERVARGKAPTPGLADFEEASRLLEKVLTQSRAVKGTS